MNAVQETRLNEIYIYTHGNHRFRIFTPRQLLAIRWKRKSYTTFCADGTENDVAQECAWPIIYLDQPFVPILTPSIKFFLNIKPHTPL